MKNFIIVCVLFMALLACLPVAEAGGCGGFQSQSFCQSSGFGFVPSGFGVRNVFIQQAPPVFINQGGGRSFQQRTIRGPFGGFRQNTQIFN